MMTHNGGSTYPKNVAPGGSPVKNLSVIGIAEESSSEDDDIPPSNQSLVSDVDENGSPSDNCVTEAIYKVQDKDIKGTLSRVNDGTEDSQATVDANNANSDSEESDRSDDHHANNLNNTNNSDIKGTLSRVNDGTEDSQATADANNANSDSEESDRSDDYHANNLNNNNNNSDESIPDENLVDQDVPVPAGTNEFPLDQNVNEVQEVVDTVENSHLVPTTDPAALVEKLFKEKSGDYKHSVSVGLSETENTEEEVVSVSGHSADVPGEVVDEDVSSGSGTSAQLSGTSPQVAQETSYDTEGQGEMANNNFSTSFMQLARSKVPPIECTDKSMQNFTEYIQSVKSQSASYYPSVMTRTPQEDSSAAVIATDILPTLLSVNSTSPPVAKDTSAHHKFQKPEAVKYSALAAHAPFKPCYPNNPLQLQHLEDAYRSGSLRRPKLFQCLMGEVDNT